MCMLIFFLGGGGLIVRTIFWFKIGKRVIFGRPFFWVGGGGGGGGGYRKFTAYHHNVGLSIVPVAIIL